MTMGGGPNLAQIEYGPDHLTIQDRAVGETGTLFVPATDTDNLRSTMSANNRYIDAAKDLLGPVCRYSDTKSNGGIDLMTNVDGLNEMCGNRRVDGRCDSKMHLR